MFPACIQYRQMGLLPGVMVCSAIGYKTHTSFVWINSNLNTDQYISETLNPMVVPYLRACQIPSFNKIIQDYMLHVEF